MTFNLQDAVKNIYDMKVGWHTSDKAGDRKKADEYAENAKQYYQQLIDNGYEDVANVLKNTNDVGAKAYYDNLMKNYSAPTVTTSKSSTPTATADLTKADGMTTDLYGVQRADKDTLSKKYDTAEDYIYNYDHTKSATGKAILDNYKFQGETARDNATASGGASNGGNIDSYAAANANRQQLAYTNAGMNAVLNDFNARMSNIRGLLSEMGVNLQNQYKSMQDTIGLKQTEEQRQFNNEETSKNNDVDRNVKISEVTGYVPASMQYSNNRFFNADGTLINPHGTDYSLIIHNAEEALKTETNPQKRADLEATIREATDARNFKIDNVEGYSKWANTKTLTAPQQTESGRRFDEETASKERMNTDDNATTKYTSDNSLEGTKYTSDNALEGTKDTNATNKQISDNANATNITIADKNNKSAKEIAEIEAQAVEDKTWQDVLKEYDLSEGAKKVLNIYAHEAWASPEEVQVPILDILAENAGIITEYDASEILRMYDIKDAYIEKNSNGQTTKAEWLKQFTWYDPKEDD